MQQQTLFKFDPNVSDAPLPRGRYEAQITDAQPRVSKAGNEMLEVTFKAHGPHGNVVLLRDYLVSSPRAKWKIKQFCKAAGIDYTKGEIDPEALRGRDMAIQIEVEEDRDGRDRNVVRDYGNAGEEHGRSHGNGNGERNPRNFAHQPDRVAVSHDDEGDEIPF
jgi:hypothetical protein